MSMHFLADFGDRYLKSACMRAALLQPCKHGDHGIRTILLMKWCIKSAGSLMRKHPILDHSKTSAKITDWSRHQFRNWCFCAQIFFGRASCGAGWFRCWGMVFLHHNWKEKKRPLDFLCVLSFSFNGGAKDHASIFSGNDCGHRWRKLIWALSVSSVGIIMTIISSLRFSQWSDNHIVYSARSEDSKIHVIVHPTNKLC